MAYNELDFGSFQFSTGENDVVRVCLHTCIVSSCSSHIKLIRYDVLLGHHVREIRGLYEYMASLLVK